MGVKTAVLAGGKSAPCANLVQFVQVSELKADETAENVERIPGHRPDAAGAGAGCV